MRHMKKLGLLLLCCLGMVACAATSNMLNRESFEKSMKDYNKMVRFREIESAGVVYMEPELREAFLKSAADIKKRGVSITDYRILSAECFPEKGTAEVVVEFDYFILPSNRLKTLTYSQDWVYREINKKKSWKLKSGLPAFE